MSLHVGTYDRYPIYVSDRPLKKYFAVVDGHRVYFGDTRYQHYHDKMGHYSALDHWDPGRRARYKRRHAMDRTVRASPGWFADQVLW